MLVAVLAIVGLCTAYEQSETPNIALFSSEFPSLPWCDRGSNASTELMAAKNEEMALAEEPQQLLSRDVATSDEEKERIVEAELEIEKRDCPASCSGHGTCNTACVCNPGWAGSDCSIGE